MTREFISKPGCPQSTAVQGRKEGRASILQHLLRTSGCQTPNTPSWLQPFGKKSPIIFLFIERSHLLATLTFFLMKLCVSLPPQPNMKSKYFLMNNLR